jgi:hypothetical protein
LAEIARHAETAGLNSAGFRTLAGARGFSRDWAMRTNCGTAAIGGHVARCEECAHTQISYNSCRNRHCTKCQGAAAKDWLASREADLLPVPYYHVVFTLPAAIGDIAYQNKAVIYDLLFKASAETLTTIAADPKHLGARVGVTSVLHSWGSAMTHHPPAGVHHSGAATPNRMGVYAKRPFGGPEAVLAYLSRYTHRVASPTVD